MVILLFILLELAAAMGHSAGTDGEDSSGDPSLHVHSPESSGDKAMATHMDVHPYHGLPKLELNEVSQLEESFDE